MKYPFSCFFLFFALSQAKAQPPAATDSSFALLSTYRPVTIKLEDPQKQHPTQGSFRHFEILDERPDTARIGVHTGAGLFGKGSRQLVFGRPASQELGDYLNTRFSNPSAPYTALVVIRVLWLSDATYTLADLSKKSPDLSKMKTKLTLRAEVYAEKEAVYNPLFRFNSLSEIGVGSNSIAGQELADVIDILADSATTIISKKGMGSRQLARDDIRQFNRSRFDPLIYNGSSLISGVYLNFEEFRNNAPSIRNYEVLPNTSEQKDNKDLILYLKGSGNESIYTRDAWGYCDGKTVYVMKDGVLIPAWREGNAYYLLAKAEEIDVKKDRSAWLTAPATMGTTAPITQTTPGGANFPTPGMTTMTPGSGNSNPRLTLNHVFTVDMDTGKLY